MFVCARAHARVCVCVEKEGERERENMLDTESECVCVCVKGGGMCTVLTKQNWPRVCVCIVTGVSTDRKDRAGGQAAAGGGGVNQ